MCSPTPPGIAAVRPLQDAPVLRPTLAEMDDLRMYLARASPLVERYGGVRIDPPPGWAPPPLALRNDSRFFVRLQRLPAAPVPHPGTGDARLTEIIVFPDSQKSVSLARYQARANRFQARMYRILFSSISGADRTDFFPSKNENSDQTRQRHLDVNKNNSKSLPSWKSPMSMDGNVDKRNDLCRRGRQVPCVSSSTTTSSESSSSSSDDSIGGSSSCCNEGISDSCSSRTRTKRKSSKPKRRRSYPNESPKAKRPRDNSEALRNERMIDCEGKKNRTRPCRRAVAVCPKALPKHNLGVLCYPAKPESSSEHIGSNSARDKCRRKSMGPMALAVECEATFCSEPETLQPRTQLCRSWNPCAEAPASSPTSEVISKPLLTSDCNYCSGLWRGAPRCSTIQESTLTFPGALSTLDTTKSLRPGYCNSSHCRNCPGSISVAPYQMTEAPIDPGNCSTFVDITADIFEKKFWEIFSTGISGFEVDVAYGVDVEAEGPFNVHGMTYVTQNRIRGRRKDSKVDVDTVRSTCAGPKWHAGNINETGVLRHLPRMPGINHPMYYIGHLFTRFCWHTEDAFLNSLSFLHSPSAEKVWYVTAPSNATNFEAYAAQEIFSPQLQLNGASSHTLLMSKTTMFDPRDVDHRGIPVYRIVQRPGTFVFTAPRAYHSGFNCGFNIAEAVNFAMPNWFPYGRQASALSRAVERPLCIPREFIIFHEALALMTAFAKNSRARSVSDAASVSTSHLMDSSCQTWRDMGEKDMLRASDAAYVATELLLLIDEGERAISEFVHATECLISEGSAALSADLRALSTIEYPAHRSDLSQAFGNGAGMLCCICGHSSHFYAAVCSSCPNSGETARCPQHFLTPGPVCDIPGHRPMVIRRYSPVLLLDLLGACEEIAGLEVEQEMIVKRHSSYVRFWTTRPMPSALPEYGPRIKLRLYLPRQYVIARKLHSSGHRRRGRPRKLHQKMESRSPPRHSACKPTDILEDVPDDESEKPASAERKFSGRRSSKTYYRKSHLTCKDDMTVS